MHRLMFLSPRLIRMQGEFSKSADDFFKNCVIFEVFEINIRAFEVIVQDLEAYFGDWEISVKSVSKNLMTPSFLGSNYDS